MTNPLRALIIDDDRPVRALISNVLRDDGWDVEEAPSAETAIDELQTGDWPLVFCDVVLGGPDGYSVLKHFKAAQPEGCFILMTGRGSAAGALEATAMGAYDYLLKPFSVADILRISSLIKNRWHLRKEVSKVHVPAGYESEIPLIGNSPKFVDCLKMVGRIARTNLPVLITGESGTGKEVVARAIHQSSARADQPFVTVNCGAIPTELIESELFGHSKGSFTGADRERMGLWEEAAGGTLFLDEITETHPLFQVKLLRALQEGEIRRVGSNRSVRVDVRVIAASNRDVEKQIKDGSFRQDLLYRLNAVSIVLPSLSERPEDIPLLAEHFVSHVDSTGTTKRNFSAEALAALTAYSWPGNIRELENAVLRAVSLSDDTIYPEHLPSQVSANAAVARERDDSHFSPPAEPVKWASLAAVEQEYVNRVLAYTEGNKQAASRILNIDRKTLARIVNRKN